ncbi:MAG: DUF2587 domain-containing protein, partial [Actinobacteria bacterium]|nr:DUF2587 domain-containing protein [Actinomycetota bacterium]
MTDTDVSAETVPTPQVIEPSAAAGESDGTNRSDDRESVEEPAKVMRIGSMIKQLLEEVRNLDLDEPARERLREIYDRSVVELGAALSDDLRAELDRLALPFAEDDTP